MRQSALRLFIASILAVASGTLVMQPVGAQPRPVERGARTGAVIFFAAASMRQDMAENYAAMGVMPAIAGLLVNGAKADNGGMLTGSPPTAGAGWHSLASGAWAGHHGAPGSVFSINGGPFTNRVDALDPVAVGAETLAQAAERGGKRVVQFEWTGGRVASINGPTVDGRGLFSGRGVATNFIAPSDNGTRVALFGLQFDHPSGFAGQPPFPAAAPTNATGWTQVPVSYSPAQEMRLRVLAAGVDVYGLNAYLFDSTNDGVVNYDRVLFAPAKNGAAAVATLRRGEWGDVKVKIVGGSYNGLTAGFWLKVEELTANLAQVRLFHTAVTRANATWPGWQERGFTGDFAEYVAQRFSTSTVADFATLEAGIVSEDTYVEQGLHWQRLAHPLLNYVLVKYRPDLALIGYPTIAEFQQQFLGLVTPTLPGGSANPAYDDAQVNGTPDGRVSQRNAFLQGAYRGADATFALVRSLLPASTTSFVASDHGAAPQFLAIDASRVLVDLGLLSAPQTANCRPAIGETIGKAKACWAGGVVQIYLNLAGRDPVGFGFQQVAAADEASTVAQIKAAFMALADANDWTGDGQPEGWQLIDRAYTKAEARYVRNGAASTADMAHPTRTGDLVVFAFPPYQFDAATPGTPVARSAFFGQEGYAPDLQSIAAGVNMRAAFFAGGDAIRAQAVASRMRTIDVAPTIAYLMGIPEPLHAQGVVRLDLVRGGNTRTLVPIIALTDFHGQLESTTFDIDGRRVPVGGAAELATLFDEEGAALGGNALLLSSGDNVGASPMNSAFLADRPAIDVENAWGVDASAYGTHEFNNGIGRLLQHQARASFPFLGANIVEAGTLAIPSWVRGTHILNYGGVRIGVIGIALQATPALVAPGATAGLKFLDELQAIRTASETLRAMGVVVQIVLLHDGTDEGRNAIGGTPAAPWKGPAITIAEGLSDTTVDAILAGESHRIANSMVGNILVVQGLAAGASYSVVQLVVGGSDVEWSGGSTRLAKSLGVAKRGDVMAIVDAANAQLATLHNSVIGTQQFDLLRDPTRLHESAMGNLVADAMRSRYAGVDAALTNSGSLRADLLCTPPSAGEPPCAITLGEVYAVLPFGNTTVIETLTGAQLQQALQSGFSPMCDPVVATGRFPQVSGLKVTYACNGTNAVVTGMWLAPGPPRGGLSPIGASTPVRIVTDSFLFSGGDGYAVLEHGTSVQTPSHDVLQVTVDYIGAHSPVGSVVEGRIVGP